MNRCYEHKDRAELPMLCQNCHCILAEQQIAERAVKALFAASYRLGVQNGGDDEQGPFGYDANIGMQPSADRVLAVMFQTDDEFLKAYKLGNSTDVCDGWIRFVYGNSGWDVISDYTTNLETALTSVIEYADSLEC